jgi:energy-coupling factor transporter ATP-binding protein EcfA2
MSESRSSLFCLHRGTMTNWIHEGKYTTTTLITSDYDLSEEPLPFLVDGIIHESMTLLYGQTCSGKSTIAAALAVALANGETHFLGRKIANDGQRMTVGIVAGDPCGAREYTRRLVETKAIGSGRVYVNEPYRPTRHETWDEVRDAAQQYGWQFVVVDNLSSFVPGSLNDDVSVKLFYEQIEQFPRDGIPVLVVAHTSDKWTDRGPSRIPMGSSLIRFGPRWWCNAYRSGGYLQLEYDGNEGTPHRITVNEPNGIPSFEVVRTADTDELRGQRRSVETLAKRAGIREFVLAECQHLNGKETAKQIAEKFGGSESSHQTLLSRGGYGIKREGDRWTRTLEAA